MPLLDRKISGQIEDGCPDQFVNLRMRGRCGDLSQAGSAVIQTPTMLNGHPSNHEQDSKYISYKYHLLMTLCRVAPTARESHRDIKNPTLLQIPANSVPAHITHINSQPTVCTGIYSGRTKPPHPGTWLAFVTCHPPSSTRIPAGGNIC